MGESLSGRKLRSGTTDRSASDRTDGRFLGVWGSEGSPESATRKLRPQARRYDDDGAALGLKFELNSAEGQFC